MPRIASFAFWPVAVALGACSPVPSLPQAPAEPVALDAPYVTPEYRIQVADVLDIRLLLNPELNESVTVRPDGHISTTIAPDLAAAGRTVLELDADLREIYAKDLRQPRVSVIVKTFAPSHVFVTGEVVTPGEQITNGPPSTLSQAIARAGGTKLSSDEANVFIVRRASNDHAGILATRYADLRHGRDPSADVRLAPYDVVFVPKSGIAEVYKWYNQYIQQFANPNFSFTFLLNPASTGTTLLTGGQ
jgi:polysaccharide export outer membrane protein